MIGVKRRVLVVDDEPSILRFVRISLQLQGFEVSTAGGGEEAVRLVRAFHPDIVVLDILMTPMNGFMVLEEIRKFSSVPVIAFTASRVAADRAYDYGANDVMVKPFKPEELIQKIDALLVAS